VSDVTGPDPHPRISVELPVVVAYADVRGLHVSPSVTAQVSRGAILVRAATRPFFLPPLGSVVIVSVLGQGDPIAVMGRVPHTNDAHHQGGFGMMVINGHGPDTERWLALVDRLRSTA
jgi:hypothetical protein